MDNDIEIIYRFKLKDMRDESFNILIDARTLELKKKNDIILPEWAELDFNQCHHCPLPDIIHKYCPVAVCLVDVADRFDGIISYDEIDLEIITEERNVSQKTSAQRGISSLIGLLIATSGCPHTCFLKPMARFHLPLSSKEDTIFRSAGMYLLAQYFLQKKGGEGDFKLEGLSQLYDNLHQLNISIAKRLRFASKTDSSVNALVGLDMFATIMSYVIQDQLKEIQHLFEPYFADPYGCLKNKQPCIISPIHKEP